MSHLQRLTPGAPLGVTVVASAGTLGRVTTRLVGRSGDAPLLAVEQSFYQDLGSKTEDSVCTVGARSDTPAARSAAFTTQSLAGLLLQSWGGPDHSWTCLAEDAGTECAWLGLLPIGGAAAQLAFAYRVGAAFEVTTADDDRVVEAAVLAVMTAYGAVSLTTIGALELDTLWDEERAKP